MNTYIQAIKQQDIEVCYFFHNNDFNISVYFRDDILSGFTYVNSINKINLFITVYTEFLTSSNNERNKFINYLEREFKIIINSTNLDRWI